MRNIAWFLPVIGRFPLLKAARLPVLVLALLLTLAIFVPLRVGLAMLVAGIVCLYDSVKGLYNVLIDFLKHP